MLKKGKSKFDHDRTNSDDSKAPFVSLADLNQGEILLSIIENYRQKNWVDLRKSTNSYQNKANYPLERNLFRWVANLVAWFAWFALILLLSLVIDTD